MDPAMVKKVPIEIDNPSVPCAARENIMMSMQTTQDRSELAVAATVTQQIRDIDSIAQGLSLAATNALLVAKRASAIGFTVVARELHGYARTLEDDLQGLVQQIHALVRRLAELMQTQRQMNRLCASCGSSQAARHNIGPACDSARAELGHLQHQVAELWSGCRAARERVEKRGKLGIAVGHSAMIEASQGGTEQLALRQIAIQVGKIVETILSGVRDLNQALTTPNQAVVDPAPRHSAEPLDQGLLRWS
jgi:uncharacterized protein YoxC